MKENILEFYVNKFNYLNNIDELDLNFIPSILRRRLSSLDKLTLSILNKTYTENIQYIVFSSQYGEVERLLKLITQYTENKEVSPSTFSSSVHNYSTGFFVLNKQNAIPYTALSACENSVSAGLLASVISNYDNILYCYSDINNGHTDVFALNLSKKKTENSDKYLIKLETNNYTAENFDNFIKIFSGEKVSLKTQIYTIERISDD